MQQWLINGHRVHGLIKSIQTVSVAASASTGTVAINAVDVNNTILIPLGHTSTTTATASRDEGRLALTNSTTVSYTTNVDSATASVMVVEFWPGVLVGPVQSGTIVVNAGSVASTLSRRVDTTRTILLYLGFNGSVGDATPHDQSEPKLVLTDGVTVTATINNASVAGTLGYMAADFN